jgi:hypothetical protein
VWRCRTRASGRSAFRRERLHGLSRCATNRCGEYFFMPGLRALRWLAEGDYE